MFYSVDSTSANDGFGIDELPGAWLERHTSDWPPRIEFDPSSWLLKISGCPSEQDCGLYTTTR